MFVVFRRTRLISLSERKKNRIGVVMVREFASSAVDRGFELRSG